MNGISQEVSHLPNQVNAESVKEKCSALLSLPYTRKSKNNNGECRGEAKSGIFQFTYNIKV